MAMQVATSAGPALKNGGTVRLHNLKHVERVDGHLVAVSRSGELAIADDYGRERERYKLPYGAVISVKEGDKVDAGAIVAKWDPHTHPIVTEMKGTVTYVGMEEGITIKRQTDELTGDEPLVVNISRDQNATNDKLNEFITAINALLGTFDTLTASGGQTEGRGVLAGDSGIRAVESMINSVLRTPFDGITLMEFGILADSKGKLKVDNKAFEKMLDANPDAFEKLFSGRDNMIDTLDKKLATYTSASTGSMKARKDNLNSMLQKVEVKFDELENKYQNHYQRYLKQYTQLAQVMASMEQTFSMFG